MASRSNGDGGVVVYVAATTEDKDVQQQQTHIETVLQGKHVQYELIDVTFDPSIKAEMRERCGGDETTAAPQIFSGDRYCGDYQSFHKAALEERVLEYLGLSWCVSSG